MLDRLAARGILEPMLGGIRDERLRTILTLRHGNGLGWAAVGEELKKEGLYYSERQIYRLYAQATLAFEKRWGAAHES